VTYLFSYGSNNPRQLASRLGHALPETIGAYAQGYHRAFRGWSQSWGGGVATLIKSKGDRAFGYVTTVTKGDLCLLDKYEGVDSGHYDRIEIPVRLVSGERVPALVYVSNSKEPNPPSQAYLNAIAETISPFWRGQEGPITVRDISVERLSDLDVGPPIPTSAGLALWKRGPSGQVSILLVHPTNAKWQGTYSIPKGHLNLGEEPLAAAIRETSEEIGWTFRPDEVTLGGIVENVKSGKVKKLVWFFFAEAGRMPDVLPRESLQLSEVDWAGFVPVSDAPSKMTSYLQPILRFLTKHLETRPERSMATLPRTPSEPTTVRDWLERGEKDRGFASRFSSVDFPTSRRAAREYPDALRNLGVQLYPEGIAYASIASGTDQHFTHRWDLPDGSTVAIYPWTWFGSSTEGYQLPPGSFTVAMWFDRARASDPDELEQFAQWKGLGEGDALLYVYRKYGVAIPGMEATPGEDVVAQRSIEDTESFEEPEFEPEPEPVPVVASGKTVDFQGVQVLGSGGRPKVFRSEQDAEDEADMLGRRWRVYEIGGRHYVGRA
jgi:predicted NUDIX family NTP pyrophosphohydrolase/cation transport regulator ChaC